MTFDLLFVFVLLAIVAMFIMALKKKAKKKIDLRPHPISKKSSLLTPNEMKLCKCLDEILENDQTFRLFAKVRWEDIWRANKGETLPQYRGFLKARHVDFLLVYRDTMESAMVIELMDRSHTGKKARERDARLKEFCDDTNLAFLALPTQPRYDTILIKEQIWKALKS